MQNWAAVFAQRAAELGGAGSVDGFTMDQIAQAWFQRDEFLEPEDQSAGFTRRVCQAMREQHPVDDGPGYPLYDQGSLKRLTSEYLYETCKQAQHYMCYNAVGRFFQDAALEFSICAKDIPGCLKERERCLGSCSGEPEKLLQQDFVTTIAKQELSIDFLGQDDFERAAANCSVKSKTLLVPLFSSNPSFVAWSSRVRVRGGFTAIDPKQCRLYPQACSAIQRLLEINPGLVYVDGEIRHRQFIPPSPPPPPFPPPTTLTDQGRTDFPPPSPPPPLFPPPYYKDAGECQPIITQQGAGIEDGSLIDQSQERAVCVYVRRILDERKPAFECFDRVSPS